MKITVKQLRSVIKEEITRALKKGRRQDLEFQRGMPDFGKGPASFEEFEARVKDLKCTLDEFKGDFHGASSLISGVYRRDLDHRTAAEVKMAVAIEKGELAKLKRLVASAPEDVASGAKWLQRQMAPAGHG
jgi:hypothetical protein